MRIILCAVAAAGLVATSCGAQAQTLQVPMNLVDAKGGEQPIGIVTMTESSEGVTLTPNLTGLPPGLQASIFTRIQAATRQPIQRKAPS